MRTGELCSIRALENGVVVSCRDPAIVKANQGKGAWRDPNREYTFPNLKKALKWINDNADTLTAADADSEYKDSFAAAVKET